MTTDPQSCHGDSDCCADLHRKVDRLLELLELLGERQAKTTGGIVGAPVVGAPITSGTGCVTQGAHRPDSIQINFEGAKAVADATIRELRRQGRLK